MHHVWQPTIVVIVFGQGVSKGITGDTTTQHSFVFEMMHNDDVLVLEAICLAGIVGANALAVFDHESKL